MPEWTFLTNHSHVLICVARNPGVRIRDVSEEVGITERTAQRILRELAESGYLRRTPDGRRSIYEVNDALPLRHPLESGHAIGEILKVLNAQSGSDAEPPEKPARKPKS